MSLVKKYQEYLDSKAGVDPESLMMSSEGIGLPSKKNHVAPLKVGIIGGGIAGLYSAMLTQKYIPDVKVKIFEANDRVGGRIYTHRFSQEPHQYFEVGAMRIPECEGHAPVFRLVEHLNTEFPDHPIRLTNFNSSCPEGNRVFVNNTRQRNGRVMSYEYAVKHCSELGFPNVTDRENAQNLFKEALLGVADALKTDFEAALLKYSHMTVRDYLYKELGWDIQKINYVELMCVQTNEFENGLIEYFFLALNFVTNLVWKTIEGGMSKLPETCAEAIKKNNGTILLNAKVESIIQHEDLIRIGYHQETSESLSYETFDAIIMAIPLPYIRTILERPYFGADLEQAMRTSYFFPLSKMGLRFHSRFWERTDLDLPPSLGGQSITDLPSRWVIYPDHGIGENGKGVLHIYNRSDDTQRWCLMSKVRKIKQALYDLQSLYPEINVAHEYAGGESSENDAFMREAFCMDWPCIVLYSPGQFRLNYSSMVRPQGNIYFAGSHLSSSLAWIVGALESAKRAVQLLNRNMLGESFVDYL